MADTNIDDAAANLSGDADSTTKKKGGAGGAIFGILKWILIGVAAVILIVTIVVITNAVMANNGRPQTNIPIGVEYTTQREDYDWYTSLDQIRTNSSDANPASIVVQVALGYKKDDKAASAEITSRRIEIIDFLRRYFSEKTVDDLRPQNEEQLKQQIRDQINDDILSNSRIRAVMFTQKDIIQQ